MKITYQGIAQNYVTDVLYGKRPTITYDTLHRPVLKLDGVVQATGLATVIDANPGNDPKISLSVDHAYNGVNFTVSQSIVPGGTYLISNSFGSAGNGLVEYHRKRLEQFKAAGLPDSSEQVLGTSLAILSATWIGQTNVSLYITNCLTNTFSLYHHQVGIAGYDKSSYVDLPGNVLSTTSLAGNRAIEDAVLFSASDHSSVYESLAVQQTSGVSADTTVKLVNIAAASNLKIYNVTAANYAAIKHSLVACLSFQAALNQGFRLILPSSCNLKEGIWSGAGFYEILQTGSSTRIGSIISVGLNGGFASKSFSPAVLTPPALNLVSLSSFPSVSHLATTFGDPIDMARGDYLYSHDDINTGVGSFPQALLFTKLYSSGNRFQDGPLGRGWTHNFAAQVSTASNSFQAMEEDSALDAVSAIVEHLASINMLADVNKPLDKMVVATLGHRWLADTQINNTAVVKQGLSGEMFNRLPDGTYNPPPGSSSKLILNADGTYTYDTLHHNRLLFNKPSLGGDILTYTDASGVQAKFGYTGDKLTSVANSLGRSLAFAYTGNRIMQAKDGARAVGYGYDAAGNMTSYTDAVSQKTTFGYLSAGLMEKFFYPSTPTVPFVTNGYDVLGRVYFRTNASGKTYVYFFAGSRSEEVAPLGDRKITYLDGFGKVLRSIDPFGFTTINAYDGQERLVKTVLPEGNAVQYAYDDTPCKTVAQKRCTHNVKSVIRIAKAGTGLHNLVDSYAYETAFNNVLTHTDPKNHVTRFTYNTLGQLTTATRTAADAGSAPSTTTYGYTAFTARDSPTSSCRLQLKRLSAPPNSSPILRLTTRPTILCQKPALWMPGRGF